jgi:predicted dehydrogenase
MKAAVLGLGGMGRRHLAALARIPGLEVAAVADRRPEALAAAGTPSSVRRFTSAVDLLSSVRPDLAVVATHAPSHHDLTRAALDAGVRRILCEKPMASSVAEADAMIEAARARGVRLAVNHGRRVEPFYRWAAAQVGSGAWGDLRTIRVACPGIGLGCVGTHYLDLVRLLSGDEIASVSGWIDPVRGPNPRGAEFQDPGGVVVMQGRSGRRYVHQHIEDGVGPAPVVVELTGGRLTVVEDTRQVEWLPRGSGFDLRPGPPPEAPPLALDVVGMAAALLEELAGEGPLSADGADGRAALEILSAAYASDARGHAPAALPLQGEDRARRLAVT